MSAFPQTESQAFETMEHVLVALRALDERDHAMNALIESIEDDRARLLALAMSYGLTGRTPPRMSTVQRLAPFRRH